MISVGETLIKDIYLGEHLLKAVYLGDELIYPSILGEEVKTEYSTWTYNITVDSGTRSRTWVSYKRDKYGDGTYGPWEQLDSGSETEAGTRSTEDINVSEWSYNWVSPIEDSTRSQTYQTRVTYSFLDDTKTIDTEVQTRTESGKATYNITNIVPSDPKYTEIPAAGSGNYDCIIRDATMQFLWDNTVIAQEVSRVVWTSVDNGFQIGNSAVQWGNDTIYRFINNTSTSVVSGTAYGHISTSIGWVDIPPQTVTQAAGAKIYGGWYNTDIHLDNTSFAASGGTSRMVMNVARVWTWNGVANTGDTETSTASIYSPQSSDGIATFNGNNVVVGSLGVTFKAATTITVSAITEHDSTRKSASITQAANYVTEGRDIKARTITYPIAPAGGGTIAKDWDDYPNDAALDTLWGFTWASGSTGTYTQAKAGGDVYGEGVLYTWTGASGNFTNLNTSNGDVSVASKGTIVSAITTGPKVTAYQDLRFTNSTSYGGTSCRWTEQTYSHTLQQAANVQSFTSMVADTFQPDATWIGATTPDNLPAERCYIGIRYYWNYAYTSGAANTSGWSRNIFYADGLRIISNPESMAEYYDGGGISVYSRGTTVGNARSCQVYVTYDGFTSNTITLTQRANAVTSTSSSCSGTTKITTYSYTSGESNTSSQANSYDCGYRKTFSINIQIMQNGPLPYPSVEEAYVTTYKQSDPNLHGTTKVYFDNPGINGKQYITGELTKNDTDYGYNQLLISYKIKYNNGSSYAYQSWSGSTVVISSGSLCICSLGDGSIQQIQLDVSPES